MCSIWLVLPCFTMKQFHGMTARNGSEYVGESKDLIITAMVEFTLENDA